MELEANSFSLKELEGVRWSYKELEANCFRLSIQDEVLAFNSQPAKQT